MRSGTNSVSEAQVCERRIWERLGELGEIGRLGDTGVSRAAFSAEDIEAKRLLLDWCAPLGVRTCHDAIGNLFIRYEPPGSSGPAVMTGSHLDSQPTGGRFDGAYGVVAALEVVEILSRAGAVTRRPVEIVAWSNEEGSRFAPGAMGSQYFAGTKELEAFLDVTDRDGDRLEDALAHTLTAIPEVPVVVRHQPPAAYVEAHIEQGPVLEERGDIIGVVEGIYGCVWVEYEIVGRAAHAGTTPLPLRRDALRAAVRLIQELDAKCREISPDCRFTVGCIEVEPGTPNTIPGLARFTVDLRDADPGSFERMKHLLLSGEPPGGFRAEAKILFESAPQRFSERVVDAVSMAATRHALPSIRMMSGAFHDALFLARICDTGMVFVPSKGGVSHHPDEYSSPENLAAGAKVLADVVSRLADS